MQTAIDILSATWLSLCSIGLLIGLHRALRWVRGKGKPAYKQTTWVFCPTCNLEQIANRCFVEDTDLVKYHCVRCGTETRWDFDAPAPLLIEVDGVQRYGMAAA